MKQLKIAVLTISDSRSNKTDKSGPKLCELAVESHHIITHTNIVPDDIYQIRATISQWLVADDVDAIITTGGTGISGRDGTPEAISPLLDKEIPGFGEMFRFLSYQKIKTSSLQSRALSGVANGKYIFVLPGSTSACKDAWEMIIQHQLNDSTKPCNLTQLMPRLLEK